MTTIIDGNSGGTALTTVSGVNQSTTGPTITTYTSGSGTYTVPAGVKWIWVRMVGGGQGGGGSDSGSGNAGGNTTFGSLTAGGGTGGTQSASGTASGGDINVNGSPSSAAPIPDGTYSFSTAGASSPFGAGGPDVGTRAITADEGDDRPVGDLELAVADGDLAALGDGAGGVSHVSRCECCFKGNF